MGSSLPVRASVVTEVKINNRSDARKNFSAGRIGRVGAVAAVAIELSS